MPAVCKFYIQNNDMNILKDMIKYTFFIHLIHL